MRKRRVAVVGATGIAGQQFLVALAGHPWFEVTALAASSRSAGRPYGEAIRERWVRQVPGVPLVIVESPYRAVIFPVLAYLDVLDQAWPPDKPAPITIVVLPEYVARHWWERVLYNQTSKRLKQAILGREHTVIADVPYRRE